MQLLPLRHPYDGFRTPSPSLYHHPHFVRAEPVTDGQGRPTGEHTFHFRRFTGMEGCPTNPTAMWSDSQLSFQAYRRLCEEYDLARRFWSWARLRHDAVPVLRRAEPLWKAWVTARTTMVAAVRGSRSVTSQEERSLTIARMIVAREAAESAAAAWDAVACELATLAHDQVCVVGDEHELPLHVVAAEIGMDITAWAIGSFWDHDRPVAGPGPALRGLRADVAAERRVLEGGAGVLGARRPWTI